MRYEVEVGTRKHEVVINRAAEAFTVVVDGKLQRVDVARVDAYTLSLIVGPAGPKDPPYVRGPGLIGPGASYDVTVAPDPANGQMIVYVGTMPVPVVLNGRRRWGRRDDAAAGGGPQRIAAPMPGKIVRILVQTGEAVRARQPVVVVEAMKMENELRAGGDGTVAEIHAREGMSVEAGALLVVIQ